MTEFRICLTGDVHQHGMSSDDQRSLGDETEPETAIDYAEITRKYDIDTTLFVTGQMAKRNRDIINQLADCSHVEIGGHTWNAFNPTWLHSVFEAASGSWYGPRWYQYIDISRTIKTVSDICGISVDSWRTHGYSSDNTTISVLASSGIEIVSDSVTTTGGQPGILKEGIIEQPINVLPDHEHLYHGNRDEQRVSEYLQDGGSYEVTNESYYVKEYFDVIKSQILDIRETGGVATVLLHPICMAVADDFGEFEAFCRWVSENGFETVKCQDVAESFAKVE